MHLQSSYKAGTNLWFVSFVHPTVMRYKAELCKKVQRTCGRCTVGASAELCSTSFVRTSFARANRRVAELMRYKAPLCKEVRTKLRFVASAVLQSSADALLRCGCTKGAK